MLSRARSSSVSLSWLLSALLPQGEAPEEQEATDDQVGHEREAQRRDLVAADRRCVEGPHPAPAAALEDPEDDQAQTDSRERRSDHVELRRVVGLRRGVHPLADEQDGDHDHDLADEDVAPAEVRRHEAADHRADRDRGSGDPADDPVGEGAVLALVVGRREGGDRRDHEHRAETFHERPAEEENGEVRAQGRDQRAEPVDREPDREGPVATPDVTELGADQHEGGHDERVHRDGALDAGDGRVEVGDDLRDRDIHHARVEDHHELRRSEDDQREPAAHLRILVGDRFGHVYAAERPGTQASWRAQSGAAASRSGS